MLGESQNAPISYCVQSPWNKVLRCIVSAKPQKKDRERCMFKVYSKALRCTFLGERKNSCSSKFVQLLLLNRMKAKWSKNRAAQGFHYINSFSSNFFGPNSKTCSCKVRAAWGRVSRGLTVLGKKLINKRNAIQCFLFWVIFFINLLFSCWEATAENICWKVSAERSLLNGLLWMVPTKWSLLNGF